MQAISDKLNSFLSNCFPFMSLNGFSKDLAYKSGAKDFVIPTGCNTDTNECTPLETKYLLPESNKDGIIFYDNIKVSGTSNDLECNMIHYTYTFDLVVWVNTNRVKFNDTQFCSDSELMYNHIVKCLRQDMDVLQIGLPSAYMRSGWKFDDNAKYLNEPYIAFRMPITYEHTFCVGDLLPLDYQIIDC